MKIIVAATAAQKKYFEGPQHASVEILWLPRAEELWQHREGDVYLDLLFEPSHTNELRALLPKPVFINSVEHTLADTNENFIRINGWDGFLQGKLVEASARELHQQAAEEVMRLLGKEMAWLPDLPGFVSARVVSMIINEAFFALAEGVSTKDEINTAMKLGTAYPFGPFEWAEKIGIQSIAGLLQKLSAMEERYRPAPLLLSEAGVSFAR